MNKKLCSILLSLVLIFGVCFSASAVNTYSDVKETDSNVKLLLAFFLNVPNAYNFDYIVFSNYTNTYLLVYGLDAVVSDNSVSFSDCKYFQYTYSDSQRKWLLTSGSTTNFSLFINHIVVSNIGVGQASEQYRNGYTDYFLVQLVVLFTAFSFISLLRGSKHREHI